MLCTLASVVIYCGFRVYSLTANLYFIYFDNTSPNLFPQMVGGCRWGVGKIAGRGNRPDTGGQSQRRRDGQVGSPNR